MLPAGWAGLQRGGRTWDGGLWSQGRGWMEGCAQGLCVFVKGVWGCIIVHGVCAGGSRAHAGAV